MVSSNQYQNTQLKANLINQNRKQQESIEKRGKEEPLIEAKEIRDEIFIVERRIHLNLKNTDLRMLRSRERERDANVGRKFNYYRFKKSSDAEEMMIRIGGNNILRFDISGKLKEGLFTLFF